MIKKLMSYIGEFKRDTILSPIFVTLEVFLEVLLPTLMALVIDNGVETGDMNYVMKIGLIMLVVAMLSLAAGTLSGVFAAKASMGFGRNLRRGMFDNIQDFAFRNIDHFSTAGLVTRMTTDVTNVQNAYQLLIRLAKGALCCFNMETGRVNNDICIGRKGGGEGELTVRGTAAHAGNDFLSGRNAVLEMAYKEIELAELNDLELGTTVTPTVIKGGTVPNGIPDHCHLYFDVRYRKFEEAQRVKEAFERIAAHSHIDGTHTDCIYKEYQVPFDETPDGIALADFVAEVSRELGMGDMGKINLGGGSDACYFTIAGVPTICAMGVCGQFNHSSKEYALVETLYTRAKLLTCAVLDLEKFVQR